MKGLIEYIAPRYKNAAEIGIGHFPDLAFHLLGEGVGVFATDIKPFRHKGLRVIMDDITEPDVTLYKGSDLIYSIRPPMELVPYMKKLSDFLYADLIVKSLSSEYPGGTLIKNGDTTFYLWSRP